MGTIKPRMGTIPESSMAAALFGKARRSVLALIFANADKSFYIRQIKDAVNVGGGSVQRELKRLSDAGIITRRRDGRQVYFQANRTCPIFPELRALVVKTVGIADKLKSAMAPVLQRIDVAFIYGSMASGQERPESDIDLMVIGDLDLIDVTSALQEATESLGREVNISLYPPDEFRSKAKEGNHFINKVLGTQKIFIVGRDSDLKKLAG